MNDVSWITDLFKSIDRKDPQAFAEFLSDDIEFRFGNMPTAQGRKATVDSVQAFFTSIHSLCHRIFQTWMQGDTLICHGMVTYTRLDGSQLSVPFANIFTLTDGRVSRYLIFADIAALYAGAA